MSTSTAPVTADEFLKLLDSADQPVELIDGEVVAMPSGGPNPERVKSNVNEILVAWLLQHRVGKVFNESAYRLDDQIVQAPDLSVLNSERVKRGGRDLLRGAPDLAVEIVSSETAAPWLQRSGQRDL